MKKLLLIASLLLMPVMGYQNSPVQAHNLTASGSLIEAPGEGFGTVVFQITGTWSATITFEGTINNSTWVAIYGTNIGSAVAATTTTANGLYWVSSIGLRKVRARISAYTSGTAVVTGMAVDGVPTATLSSSGGGPSANVDVLSIAAGNNNIGDVDVLTLPTIPAGNNNIGDVDIASSVLPVNAATSTKQSDGSQKSQIVDGSGNVIGSTSNSLNVNITGGAGSGGTAATDNSAFTAGSGSGTPMEGLYDNASPATMTEDRVGVMRISRHRSAHVTLYDTAGVPLSVGAQYAEDAAHASGDFLMMAGAVRRDAPASSTATDGDNATLNTDATGRLWTNCGPAPASTWQYAAAAGGLVNTTGVTVKAAAGSGVRNYVAAVQCISSHQTIGTEFVIRDGAAGTVMWRGWAQPAGGGYAPPFPVPLRGSTNTLVEIATVTTTATAGVLCNLQGYESAQ